VKQQLPLLPGVFTPTTAPRPDLGPGITVVDGAAAELQAALLDAVANVAQGAPFRHWATPTGTMSAAMTNCGRWGWVSDAHGYRYVETDPDSQKPWPPLPALFTTLATECARAAGFPGFLPDACLVNRYAVGARMGLHQDKNERDFTAPIVSVSLGLPATFLWGGDRRNAPVQRFPMVAGDVLVWGGPARLRYHGVAPLKAGAVASGPYRYNLTLRKAG
jgi:DNA oxidative demethylase